ncbi:cardiolipin synthase [Bacillus toyonensis]|uniref:cardiolipin synthase n=1 Tax=Bacillus toyonensis TaxID=155322 RepID=UPI000BF1F430|nr:cardiolipin synthase [Bacillus toyonensis]MDF9446901.1 cardiolipin synthase [Bacillus toyonensis]MDG1560327.1 cardiolipin synthase [Bacillus toyonensis]PEO64346.1 cardiolipin synthase [Bacillus toyonensis]PFX84896.1 cardiolipin synthase [Bacillus toyonensis]PFX97591.1 cardiolipin synthase [Bacillus toyonensis]
MNKKMKFIFWIIPLAIFLSIGGYSIYFGEVEDKTILITKDFPSTSRLEDMVKEADVVAIGNYDGFDSIWNMARNPQDISQEDQENYVEGHLYNFNVKEVLKGDPLQNRMKINYRYAEKIEIDDSNAKVVNEDPLYIKLEIGKKYMLFLKKDENMNHYFGAIEPFAIMFDENDIAYLQSNLLHVDEERLSVKKKQDHQTYTLKNQVDSKITDTISNKNIGEIKIEIAKYN